MFGGSTFSGEPPARVMVARAGALSREPVMRYISPRRIVLLAPLFLLIAPWASAAPRPGSTPPASASMGIGIPDVLSLAWRFITGGWMKEGCNIDPDGRCVTTLPTKEGCNIDPSGYCLPGSPQVASPSTWTDVGCNIDPNGHCIQ